MKHYWKLNKLFGKPNTGQALVEITIAIGLSAIIITALVTTVTIGLRNSQFAQNQVSASKIASDLIEQVKAARERNCAVSNGTTSYTWYGSNTIFNSSNDLNGSYNIDLSKNPCIQKQSGSSSTSTSKFTSSLSFTNISSNLVTVSANVTWNDTVGDHSSLVSIKLSNIK